MDVHCNYITYLNCNLYQISIAPYLTSFQPHLGFQPWELSLTWADSISPQVWPAFVFSLGLLRYLSMECQHDATWPASIGSWPSKMAEERPCINTSVSPWLDKCASQIITCASHIILVRSCRLPTEVTNLRIYLCFDLCRARIPELYKVSPLSNQQSTD